MKESLPSQPDQERTSFKPGGALEHLGGMSARFGDVEIQVIASPDDPAIGFITGLKGSDVASVLDDIAFALKEAGFKDIQYRADNEDGRAAARERLFRSLKSRIDLK